MTAKPSRPPIDWEAIEREYRAGQLSIVEIAAIHRLSRAAIQKRAKAKGWKRDLAERVRKAVAEKLVAPEVAVADDNATVEMAAERGAQVQRLHQKRAARLQTIVDALATKLEATEGLPITMLATAAGNLSAAFKNLVAIERQAFNLDAESDKDTGGVTVEIVRFAE